MVNNIYILLFIIIKILINHVNFFNNNLCNLKFKNNLNFYYNFCNYNNFTSITYMTKVISHHLYFKIINNSIVVINLFVYELCIDNL